MKKIFLLLTFTFFLNSQVHAGGDIMNAVAGATSGMMLVNTISNSAQGTTFVEKCTSMWPYCAMAVLAFAQAAMSLKGAKDAKETQDASQCVGSYCGDIGAGGTLDPTTGLPIAGVGTLPPPDDVLGRIQNDINTQIAELGSKGYTYDPVTNSVNTPNNGSVPATAFGSDAGLKSLGFSDNDISDVKKIANSALKDALKDAAKYAGSDEYGSGGGGSRIKPGPGYDNGKGFDMNKYLASLMNKKGSARGVAGLEKKYGSDQIGVAQDNIFKMVHRRYEAKQSTLHP